MIEEKPNGLHLLLPFPHSKLLPNWARKQHWRVTHSFYVELRDSCYYLTRQRAMELDQDKEYTVSLLFCPPDKRTRDRDNLQAAYKAGLDGMCRALGIDDSRIHPVSEIGPVMKPLGKVEVRIVEKTGT